MLSVTFDVNHKVLGRGVYLAKLDRMGKTVAVTLDLRMRRPYREKPFSETEMHTFEHAYATAIRAVMDGKEDQVLYFGPMGCNTGFYLLFQVEAENDEILEEKVMHLPRYMKEATEYLKTMDKTPAKNEWQCGNCYTLGDKEVFLGMGKDLEDLLSEVEKEGYHRYTRLTEEECREIGRE